MLVFQPSIFRGYVSFREGDLQRKVSWDQIADSIFASLPCDRTKSPGSEDSGGVLGGAALGGLGERERVLGAKKNGAPGHGS